MEGKGKQMRTFLAVIKDRENRSLFVILAASILLGIACLIFALFRVAE